MKVYIDSDKHGKELKEDIYNALSYDYKIIDLNFGEGIYPSVTSNLVSLMDYNSRGILICRTGIGVSIVANKFRGIYANNCTSIVECEYFRKRNNGNVLCLGTDLLTVDTAINICNVFLETEFDEINRSRIDLIDLIEKDKKACVLL